MRNKLHSKQSASPPRDTPAREGSGKANDIGSIKLKKRFNDMKNVIQKVKYDISMPKKVRHSSEHSSDSEERERRNRPFGTRPLQLNEKSTVTYINPDQ